MIKIEIVDSLADIHRAARSFVEPLEDKFQWPDILAFVSGLKDDDPDNKTGTVVDGFIKDLPLISQEIKTLTVDDARETVRAAVVQIRREFPAPHKLTEFFVSFLNQAVETYDYLAKGPQVAKGWGELFAMKKDS